MHAKTRSLVWLNVLGGLAVLVSYAYGVAANPLTRGDVWGGVPDGLRPLYTVSMLLAAAGYFPFTWFAVRRLDPERTRIAGRFGYGLLLGLYALILLPSALWMPLTFAMLEAPSAALWWSIRIVLFAVGAGSLGLLAALVAAKPRSAPGARRLAIAGCVAFCFQTALLDAVVWPAYFPV